jgi:hypothetical protein
MRRTNVGGKVDTVSGQVQSLNDSVDELKSRIAKLDKTFRICRPSCRTSRTLRQQPGGNAEWRTGV